MPSLKRFRQRTNMAAQPAPSAAPVNSQGRHYSARRRVRFKKNSGLRARAARKPHEKVQIARVAEVGLAVLVFGTFDLGESSMAYRLAFLAAVVAAWLATPSAANHHCLTPTIKSVADNATRAVNCIVEWQTEVTKPRNGVRTDGGIQTHSTVVALAGSIGVAVARFGQRNAPDGECRTAFAQEVRNLRPTYDSGVRAAMQVSGGSLDVRTLNQLTEQCRVDSQILGEIAEYGVRPSGGATASATQGGATASATQGGATTNATASAQRETARLKAPTARESQEQCRINENCTAGVLSALDKWLADVEDAPDGAKALASQLLDKRREILRLKKNKRVLESGDWRSNSSHEEQMQISTEITNNIKALVEIRDQLQSEFPDFWSSFSDADKQSSIDLGSRLPTAQGVYKNALECYASPECEASWHASINEWLANAPAGRGKKLAEQRLFHRKEHWRLTHAYRAAFEQYTAAVEQEQEPTQAKVMEIWEQSEAMEIWEQMNHHGLKEDELEGEMQSLYFRLFDGRSGRVSDRKTPSFVSFYQSNPAPPWERSPSATQPAAMSWKDGDETCACRDDDDLPTTSEMLDAVEEGLSNVDRMRRLFGRGANDDDGNLLDAVQVMKAVEDVWKDGDETCACRDDDDLPTTSEMLDAVEEGRNNVDRMRRLFGR